VFCEIIPIYRVGVSLLPLYGCRNLKAERQERVDSDALPMTGIGKLKSISECLKGVDCCLSLPIKRWCCLAIFG